MIERPPPKVAPVGMTPGGVLLRENRMYGCENSVHKEPPVLVTARVLRIVSVLLEKNSLPLGGEEVMLSVLPAHVC